MAAEKTTYILTWNPSKWNWEDYDAAVEKTGQGESYVIPWSTGSTKGIRKDDRLFMLRQNVDRGLIAAGYAASDCFQDSHWDGSGRNANFVRFEIDCLLPIEKRLPIENLLDETAFTWNNMPASGMSLPPEDAEIVEHLWLDHLASHQSKTTDSKLRNPAWQRDELILALDPSTSVIRRRPSAKHTVPSLRLASF